MNKYECQLELSHKEIYLKVNQYHSSSVPLSISAHQGEQVIEVVLSTAQAKELMEEMKKLMPY